MATAEKDDLAAKAETTDDAADEERETAEAASSAADDADDTDDADEQEEKPAPTKPAPTKPAAKTGASKPGAQGGKPSGSKPGSGAKRTGPGARPSAKHAAPPPKGGFGKSLVLFIVIVGGLAMAFWLLGQEQGGAGPAQPKWKVKDTVDVEITLIAQDRRSLACASADEIEGRHCLFEAQNKVWSKGGDPNDDKKLLRPYTTTNGIQFVAAGLWSEPALADASKLPRSRFAVKCKYTVEGKLKRPAVRWNEEGPWHAQNNEWYSGTVSDCSLVQ